MVAFKDFIKEASDLRPAEVNKYAGRPDDRIPVFLNKVSQGAKFATTDGKEVIIDKSEVERLKNEILVPGYKGIPALKTTDGTEISMKNLAKTGEFGGVGQSKTGERILANRGNTLEGVLGALATTPTEDDWFDVHTYTETSATASKVANFTGNYVWIRAKLSYTAGSVTSIILNH